METDTIAAIATAMAASGIGIIRISGEDAVEIADRVFYAKNGIALKDSLSHTIHYGYIKDENEIIDEVIVLLMKAPNSYTREDTVEIDCHGGVLVMQKILEVVVRHGARPAEPGEFTKRAFLNGRIDLTQAESVIDIINSKNEFALKSSVQQLRGAVRDQIQILRDQIIHETAFIESAIDDPEHYSLDDYADHLLQIISEVRKKIQYLVDTSDQGRVLKEGINTVIVGKPNVGKSSLLNVLAGSERAIVTEVAGTTRDVLEEQINLNGILLNMIDTAGIRKTDDIVEKIGVDKAKNQAEASDLILYVIDSSVSLDENDREILKMIQGKQAIILLNKSDLDMIVDKDKVMKQYYELNNEKNNIPVIEISVRENIGISQLEDTLKYMFYAGKLTFNDEIYISNIRHKAALENAYESLKKVNESIDLGMPEDFYSIDLMDAYESLGSITGETIGEDLINEIFSKFCMGK